MKDRIITFLIIILLFSCSKENKQFTLLSSKETSIDFKNTLTNTPELNILNYLYYYNGAGVAAADFNNDGWIDLYFTGNRTEDKLYLNQKDFKFLDITEVSGINNAKNWTTGVTTADINNDGLLDIYIAKVGAYSENSHNLLYINQGIDEKGIPKFKEEAKKYGLDISTYATQTAFFDYDLDGDLDMYLLNHSVHPNRTYGNGNKRNTIDSLSGDRLYKNENGFFKDNSIAAGIHQGSIGYGLGISISDISNDGYPDVYIGNDFFENDYLYINQKNGTFKDFNTIDETILGHTTHYSMGNDIADINNDGLTDILSVDMLPENLESFKTSGTEYNFQTYNGYLKNGYTPQFMQNTLHLNNGSFQFTETAFSSGIAATEWSWAPLIADFDNDGLKDIYISNGILGATNDMDFINFIANENIQKRLGKGMKKEDLILVDEIPEKHISNYFFKNNGDNTFQNVTKKWFKEIPSFSNGSIYADLDNDGDLDLVVNNVNENAFVIKNNARELLKNNNYLKINFKGNEKNRFGIGATVRIYSDTLELTSENYNTRGFMSAIAPELHFGLGAVTKIDSLRVIWPDGNTEKIETPQINSTLSLSHKNAKQKFKYNDSKKNLFLSNVAPKIPFTHKDFSSIEFNRNPLIPFASTNLGPKTAVGDINNDGREDLFIGGSKSFPSALYLQEKDGHFTAIQNDLFKEDALNEDIDNIFFDADNDGDTDLIVISAGNEFITGNPLSPRLYFNESGMMVKDTLQFKNIFINASSVKAIDIDNDNDNDLIITSNGTAKTFGETTPQYIFQNDGNGKFIDITATYARDFQHIGNVQDIKWIDLNNDSYIDAIAVGHWMPISIFINNGEELKLLDTNLNNTNGWWNSIEAADFDKDGDIDFVAGNWGLNTRLKASKEEPITLYSNDFDDNGSIEPIVSYFYKGKETTFSSKEELVKQLPILNKKYLSYADFASAPFDEIFPKEKIDKAYKKQVFKLESTYFENNGNNTFTMHKLPFSTQNSSINDIEIDDFNNDGFKDLLLVGNNYEISTQLGRLDALNGLLLINDQHGFFNVERKQNFKTSGPARDINKIKIQNKVYYIITINNSEPVFLQKETTTP